MRKGRSRSVTQCRGLGGASRQSVCQVYLARTLTLGKAGTGSSILSSFNFVLDRYRLSSLPENERVDLSGIAITRAIVIVIAMCGYEGVVV